MTRAAANRITVILDFIGASPVKNSIVPWPNFRQPKDAHTRPQTGRSASVSPWSRGRVEGLSTALMGDSDLPTHYTTSLCRGEGRVKDQQAP